MRKKFMKTNSSYRYGCYHVGRTDMWGSYCPETGEYYLACNAYDPIPGEYVEVLASARYIRDDEWQEQSACGYSYEVVRELLQLGHLTSRTLERFLEEEGEVWWDQPNYSKEEIKMAKVMLNGEMVDFDVAVNMMNAEICEAIHEDIAPCTDQEFVDEYVKRHEAKYGETFVIN